MARPTIMAMCVVWPWPLRYDLGSGNDILVSWTTNEWNMTVYSFEYFRPILIWNRFAESWIRLIPYFLYYSLYIIQLAHFLIRHQSEGEKGEIFPGYTTGIRIQENSRDMAGTLISPVCIVTLTLEIRPWINVMTHSLVMDNNFVKINNIQHYIRELLPRQGLWLCVQCYLDLGDIFLV